MKRFSLRMEDDLHEWLRELSFNTGKSINQIIIDLLEKLKEEK